MVSDGGYFTIQANFIMVSIFLTGVEQSLGLQEGKISNSSLKASSTLNRFHKPAYGRLNTIIEGGNWCARDIDTSQYFQVDLHEVHKLTNIILQGKYSGRASGQGWVTKFSVTYSNDGVVWSQHIEEGLGVSVISFTSGRGSKAAFTRQIKVGKHKSAFHL